MQPVSVFDDLYVVSDLHMGGRKGSQIFDRGELAAKFISHLARQSPEKRVCLVINGDFVDFLAEPNAECFDPNGAVSKLERIAADTAFAPVFTALQAFTSIPRRELVIVLGNHDLELALPWVEMRFIELIAGDDLAACGRVTLAFDGAGYRCRVGDAEVLCVHGNEVDAWNATDHERLRRVGREIVQGRVPETWKPNAGSRMVVEVMNEIKARHPFVDLLKPETQAVIPALLALEPTLAGQVAEITKVALRMTWDKIRMRFGFLSAEETGHDPPPTAVLHTMLGGAGTSRSLGSASNGQGSALSVRTDRPATDAGRKMLALAEQHIRANRTPLELVADSDDSLGPFGGAWSWVTQRSDAEVMRAALDGLKEDGRTFNLADADTTFAQLDQLIGPSLRFVITGHSHLRRALARRRGNGFYYNTGTWARLMQILPADLNDEASFRKTFEALQAKTLAEIDRLDCVRRLPTAAHISAHRTTARGRLLDISLKGGRLSQTTVPGSEFPKE